MKTLDEKKKLAKFARGLGQPDLELEESIRREEELTARLFSESKKEPPIQILKEQLPPAPAPAVEVPKEEDLISQTMNALSNPRFSKPPIPDLRDAELKAIRQQISDLVQKMGTLSWGGGGTGIVRLWNADDLDRNSAGNGKFVKFQDGWFVFDEINPYEIVHNTTEVTTNNYVVVDSDYYVGVNNASYTTITLPANPLSGRTVIIKDESGNAQRYPIKIDGNIDNDPDGAEIRINNGGVQLIYRNGWRIV